MQKFVNVRTTAESVKPLEIDDYHVYVNTGIKEIHEEAKEGDLSSGFDGFEIETQEIYEKDEYIQLMAEKNSSLEEQVTDLQLALADVYEQMCMSRCQGYQLTKREEKDYGTGLRYFDPQRVKDY